MTDPLLQVFFEEAFERLADCEEALVQLEKTPHDFDLLNRIFRCVHTLKGNSAMLGFHEIARFTHTFEDLLEQLRSGLRVVTRPVADTLLAAEDILRLLVTRAQSGMPEGTPEDILAAEKVLETIQALLKEPEGAREAAVPLTEIIPEASPSFSKLDVLAIMAGETASVGIPGGSDARNVETVTAEKLSAEPHLSGETGAGRTTADGGGAPSGPGLEGLASRFGDRDKISSLRISIDRVDRLINLVGELVISQSMVSQTVSEYTPDKIGQLKEAVAQMDRHARELHERMMSVRMVPLRQLFGRFPRLVRDLVAAADKRVALEMSGEDTELDKTVIEKISDPLTHLVRNAIDHGLELPAERRSAGKPEAGKIHLRAYQQSDSIYIEVSDDGRGLDPERILAKAVQLGLVPPNQNLSGEEITSFIFLPGFSTAEKVTELSGRGVGMDVVKKNVEALGGHITIRSERGQGTRFRIQLPLTLAILDGQVIQVGSQVYLVPLVTILESIRPALASVHSVVGADEVVMVRGKAVPLLRIHRLFGIEARTTVPTQGIVVIVEHDGQLAAILADEILGQQQLVIKSLESNYQKVEGVAGATILGDGRVALILDVPGLMNLARSNRKRSALHVA